MNFEKKPLSTDSVIAGLNDGSIERGNKGDEQITALDGTEIQYYPERQEVYFQIEGVYAQIDLNSKIVRLREFVSDKSVFSTEIEDKARFMATQWSEQGLFDTKK